ncbi:glycosyltransferase family 4 protein [Chlamydiota bacterium]
MNYFLIFAIACAITFLITPTIRFFALRFSLIDRRSTRKIHTRIVTRFGGFAIYIGVFFAILAGFYANLGLEKPDFAIFKIIFIASTLILFLGIYDDAKGANAWIKLFVQLLATLILIRSGFIIKIISNPFGSPIKLGNLGIPITILWFISITNAINLIDGLDGLANGIVFICSIALFPVFFITSKTMPAFFSLAIAGACLGFLRYNFFPAKIFLGDTGSMFLGFSLASLAILTNHKTTITLGLLVPLIGLGIPIFDTTFAFFRRVIKRKHPFKADNEHIHHFLLKKNLSQKQVVYSLWIITALLNIGAFYIFLFR